MRSPKFSKFKPGKLATLSFLFILSTFMISTVVADPSFSSFAQGSSLGPVFSTPINLSNNKGHATNPDITNVGTNVYVAWSEGQKGLMFRESPDGGVTWYPPVSSTAQNLAPAGVSSAPLLSANGTNVYVVWSETLNGSTVAQIMEATSINNGLNFSAPFQITGSSTASLTPVIASWGDNVYVAWTSGTNSYISCSSNAGASWTNPFQYGSAHEPELAASGSYLYAVSDDSLYVFSNNCSSYSRGPYYLGSEPWIWASGPNVYAAGEGKGTTSSITLEVSNDYGVIWNRPIPLSANLSDVWAPMVYARGNSAWIAVHDYPGATTSQVYMYTTTNAGESWSGPVALSQAPKTGSDTSFPFTIASSDGQNVFVAWSQQISTGYWQLYTSYSANGGLNWTASPGIDASQNPTGTQGSNNNDLANAAISSYGTSCYATWQLISGTKDQVYFSASSLGSVYLPASMSIKPVKGSVGTTVTVQGSNFLPSTSVTIQFDGAAVTSALSNTGGNFTATFAVPSATAGTNIVTATDGKNILNSNFNVVSSISEKPVTGLPAKLVNVTGTGYAANSNVIVYFNSTQIASATTNGQGSFVASYNVPNIAAGKYAVEAIDASGDSSTINFTIS